VPWRAPAKARRESPRRQPRFSSRGSSRKTPCGFRPEFVHGSVVAGVGGWQPPPRYLLATRRATTVPGAWRETRTDGGFGGRSKVGFLARRRGRRASQTRLGHVVRPQRCRQRCAVGEEPTCRRSQELRMLLELTRLPASGSWGAVLTNRVGDMRRTGPSNQCRRCALSQTPLRPARRRQLPLESPIGPHRPPSGTKAHRIGVSMGTDGTRWGPSNAHRAPIEQGFRWTFSRAPRGGPGRTADSRGSSCKGADVKQATCSDKDR